MPLPHSSAIPSASEYEIDYSARLDAGTNKHFSKTFSSAGSQTTWTWSGWIKPDFASTGPYQAQYLFTQHTTSYHGLFGFYAPGGKMKVVFSSNAASGGGEVALTSNQYIADPTNWYHFVYTLDTTNSTAADRARVYINGQRITDWASATYPNQNSTFSWNKAGDHFLGCHATVLNEFGGYMAEVNFIDGQSLTADSFGETGSYGEWIPKEYSGTYPNNSFYLDFSTSSNLGDDKSGNSFDWSADNMSSADRVLDTPTNTFCTWNRASTQRSMCEDGLSQGNTKYNPAGRTMPRPEGMKGTISVSSGKWYFEVGREDANNGYHTAIAGFVGTTRHNYALYSGTYFYGDSDVNLGFGSPGSDGEISACAFDLDNNKIWFSKNGTWYNSGNPATGANPTSTLDSNLIDVSITTYHPNNSYTGTDIINCGQDSSFAGLKTAQGNTDSNGYGDFYYSVPNGFLALCSQNLETPSVKPTDYFNTVLYSGNNSTQSLTANLQPDLVWIKRRNAGDYHVMFDTVRGLGDGKALYPNGSNTEGQYKYGNVSAVSSTGFTVATGTSGINYVNASGGTYVAWNWKVNGSSSSNTNGSITSSVNASQNAGISICSWTGNATAGATVGHGLSKAPEMIIVKDREGATNWSVYHASNTSAPETDALALNTTDATSDYLWWNDTAPTSTVFSLGAISNTNANGNDFVGYCFHSVEGFSKCGSWVGNAADDATYIFTGFTPAFVLYKKATGAANWYVIDNKRDPDNIRKETIYGSAPNAEYTSADEGTALYFYSNGFKPGGAGADMNGNNETYVYIAFASIPAKFSNAQ